MTSISLTWVQTHELAALLGVLAVLLAALGPLAEGSHAHLWLPPMAGAAQARVISFGGEVEPFIHHIVLDVNTCLTCNRHTQTQTYVTSRTSPKSPHKQHQRSWQDEPENPLL